MQTRRGSDERMVFVVSFTRAKQWLWKERSLIVVNCFEIISQIASFKGHVYTTADILRRHKFGDMGGDVSFFI